MGTHGGREALEEHRGGGRVDGEAREGREGRNDRSTRIVPESAR